MSNVIQLRPDTGQGSAYVQEDPSAARGRAIFFGGSWWVLAEGKSDLIPLKNQRAMRYHDKSIAYPVEGQVVDDGSAPAFEVEIIH